MPTFCDIIGVKNYVKKYTNDKKNKDGETDYFDGLSFYPTLRGKRQKEHAHLYWEFSETDQIAVRKGNWKLLVKKGKPMLFNLENDLHEDHDIASENPETVKELVDIIKQEHTENPYYRITLPQ